MQINSTRNAVRKLCDLDLANQYEVGRAGLCG